ncbi:nitroreductase family protein [Inmirania thermothiophila]|uniref:Nitroreductase n=1 Tax=Inmirania thermothiophila TaxID=1750597 RepID=A0A3N1Y7B8_9GAMM|nr:nitroreductase family protein [Inmirania thermothiophila]ROR34703.1 nitroreductase [Inmirania thermothiophila]
MWDFFETVRHRHSVRHYHPDLEVEEAKLHAVLETACAAPSAGDLQSYHIVVVRDPALRQGLAAAAEGQGFVAEAPVSLIFCADPDRSGSAFGERGRSLYALQDATIAAAYAQLAAVAAGLASTWVGYFDEQAVAELVGLGPGLRPVAIILLGYAAELPEPSPRRRMDEVVTRR